MQVALFVTCLADAMFPEAARATVTVLERLGHTVVFPEAQTCCGQMHINTGYQRQAHRLVRQHVKTFEPFDAVVGPSGSCVGSARHQHALVARSAGDDLLAGPGTPELLRLLAERLADYEATVHMCAPDGLTAALHDITQDWRFVLPAGSGIFIPGAIHDEPHLSHAELNDVDAAVTGCAAACAETGTIVLDATADQGRRSLTLVPDRHVCVVYAHQVVHTIPELVRRLRPSRPLTFVSGPSATSDIELDRVAGVHGPRTLIVVLVSDTGIGQ